MWTTRFSLPQSIMLFIDTKLVQLAHYNFSGLSEAEAQDRNLGPNPGPV